VLDTLQNRASDPRDHTAAGDIEDVNSEVKPRLGNEKVEGNFNRDLFLSDQLFEGCLLLDDKDKELLSQPSDSRTEDKKTHITTKEKLWPSNNIPYDTTFNGLRAKNEDRFERVIREAIEDFHKRTCLKFRRKEKGDDNWIEFFVGTGCYSQLGRKLKKGQPTYVSLGPSCWKKDIVEHMILHALGFFHEQNRSDRDKFIKVNWGNIANGKSSIFHRHPLYNTEMYHKLQYDFSSIMHCPRDHFSRRRHRLYTVQALHNQKRILGGDELSELDIKKLEMMFCEGRTIIGERDTPWTQWSSCSKSCGLGQRFRRTECKGGQCEDVKEEMRACRLQKCISTKLDSNFESGTGSWPIKEWYPESCEWTIMKSQGKLIDHTSGIGSFLQADVRSSCKPDQSAYLVSDMHVKSNYKRCFTFFYVLSGENVGSLDLYIVYEKGEHMMIWERKGDQGSEWKQGAVTLPIIEEKFRLKFIFKKGQVAKTTVLLDDIYVDDGECLEGTQRCINSAKGCRQWAKDGECFKNPNFMMRRCCKSCQEFKCIDQNRSNRCEQKVEYLSTPHCPVDLWVKCCGSCRDCLDWHPMCETWAKSGECDNNPPWMKANCKQSCGVCMKLADRIQNR